MKGRYFIGILLMVLGAGLLMDRLGILSFGNLVSTYWPSILIVAGLIGLLERGSSKLGNLIVLSIGVMFQLNRLGWIGGDMFQYLFPVILILIGLNIVFTKGRRETYREYEGHYGEAEDSGENWKEGGRATVEDYVDRTVIMSGIDTINSTQNFKGGSLVAIMGGIDLDLRGAKMASESCQIEATAIAGGIEITVPRTWKVEVRGTPILGGYSNNTGIVDDPAAPLLIVKGAAIMGGVEIKW